jgi:hypothetical protein
VESHSSKNEGRGTRLLCHGASIFGGYNLLRYEKRNYRSTHPISNGYGSSLAGICLEVESF